MVQREARMVALALVVAILLYTTIAFLGTPIFWGALLLLVLVVAGLIVGSRGPRGGGAVLGGFLCDSCKYNDLRYCSKPDRPNVNACDEYRRQ